MNQEDLPLSIEKKFDEITEMLQHKAYVPALKALEQIQLAQMTPAILSAYALCLAEVKGTFKTSTNLCHDAIKKDPKNPEHYHRQGRILMLSGKKKDAIWVLRMGLRHGRHRGIIDTLGAMGIRRPPPINFLSRTNPLNKFLGLLLSRLNLR